ncbi:MAG TPA: hypothetical protein VFF21_01515 [Flavobacteriaceae bacterium]|nr:hypothetical protein [Flavobacteriaceae bacterium]
MDVLEIRYKKSRINFNLIFVVAGLIFFGSFLYFGRDNQFFGYAWLGVAVLYAYNYYRQRKYPYVVLPKNEIIIYEAFGKRIIPRKDILDVTKSIGDYRIKTPHKTFKILGDLISPESKEDLDKEMQKLFKVS